MYVRFMQFYSSTDSYVPAWGRMGKEFRSKGPYSARTIYVSVFIYNIILPIMCGKQESHEARPPDEHGRYALSYMFVPDI